MNDDKWGAGDPSKWQDHGSVIARDKIVPLIYGEHPHSRSDNKHYVKMPHQDEPVAFSGHRVLIDVTIEMSNYLKQSHLSGDEVRKDGNCKIYADKIQVFSFSVRDTQYALLKAHQVINDLLDHPSNWMSKDERDKLAGRKIYYDRTPAVISRINVEYGEVIVTSANGQPFPPSVDEIEDDDYEAETEFNTGVLDPKIWWFRK